MHFLYLVFILYTEDFSMRHYVGFSQIGSHIKPYTRQVYLYVCQVGFNICMHFYMQAYVYAVTRIMYH